MRDTPAFPTTKPLDSWGDPNQGMTLRDYFAAKAMQALISADQMTPHGYVAMDAYGYAEAMLKAREA